MGVELKDQHSKKFNNMPKGKSISEIGKEEIDKSESNTPIEEVVETPQDEVEESQEIDETESIEEEENLNNPNEEGGESEEDSNQEEKSETSTGQEETQPKDSFATNFDPNKLSDELKPVYKQMQGDYTRKTQEVAKLKGDYDKVMRYVPLLNKVLANEELVQQVLGIKPNQTKEEVKTEVEEEIPTDPKEFAKWVKDSAVKEFERKQEAREQIRGEQEAVMKEYHEAESVDPRLNSDLAFQNVIIGLVSTNPDFKSGKVNATQATKDAIKFYDGKVEELLDIRIKERREMLLKKKNVIRDSDGGGNTIQTSDKPVSIRDAYKQAEAESFKNN